MERTKRAFSVASAAVCVLLSALLISCSSTQSSQNNLPTEPTSNLQDDSANLSISSNSPSQPSNQGDSLDEQASVQAEQFFSDKSMKCEEYYYYKYNLDNSHMYQCKYAPTVSVDGETYTPRQVSEADRLNGVDPLPVAWRGKATIHLGLCRSQEYGQKSMPGYDAWSSWMDTNDDYVPLTNKKGQWEFFNKPTGNEAYTVKVIVPITCEDVPNATRRIPANPPQWSSEAKNGAGYSIGYYLRLPASYDKWFSLGKGPMKLRLPMSFSQINIDGTNNTITPSGGTSQYGAQTSAPDDALAPGLKLGAVIVKIGQNGKPIQPFTDTGSSMLDGYQIDSSEEVFIAINDFNFSDNRGEHMVIVEGEHLNNHR